MRDSIDRTAYVNRLLMAANVIFFLYLEIAGSSEDAFFMYAKGAMLAPAVLEGKEYYRLVTAMFMHFGIGHLVNNMLVLFVMGEPLEQALGHFRYLILYFVSGIGANWISMMRRGADSMVISAGASGAIFGVIGGLLSLAARNKGRLGNLSTRQLIIMVLFSLYFGFTSTGVDNTAHVSGLILGAILRIFLHKRSKGYQTWEV